MITVIQVALAKTFRRFAEYPLAFCIGFAVFKFKVHPESCQPVRLPVKSPVCSSINQSVSPSVYRPLYRSSIGRLSVRVSVRLSIRISLLYLSPIGPSAGRLPGLIAHHLRLEVGVGGARQRVGVQLQPLVHPQPPAVPHLAAQVQVQLGHQQTVRDARQTRRPAGVRSRHVARAVKVAEVAVRRPAVSRRELVRKLLRAHPVDGEREVRVGDGGVARPRRPTWAR